MGAQSAAVAARRRTAGAGVLLRQARLHRDLALGPVPRARLSRCGWRSARRGGARRARRGRRRAGGRRRAALRRPFGARACDADQYPRSRCDRAGRRPLQTRAALSQCAGAVATVRLFRSCRHAPRTRAARRCERRARRGVVVAEGIHRMSLRDARRPLRGFLWRRMIAWLAIGIVVILSLIPQPLEIPVTEGDKWGHAAAYAALMMWFVQLYERPAHARLGWGLLALGICLDCSQGLTPYRMFDYYDLLADCVGVLIGWLLGGTALGSIWQRTVGRTTPQG